MSFQLIPVNSPAEMKAAGLPFQSEHAARWAFRQRHQNGLSGGFVRIGRRIFIDAERLMELARRQST